MKKYTVSEYASKHNISKSVVYQMIHNELKDNVVRESGKIYIVEGDAEHKEQETTKKKQSEVETGQQNNNTEIELDKANKKIENLQSELAKEREINRETEKKLLDMMGQVIELTKNSQILIARTQEQQQLLLAAGKEKKRIGLFSWLHKKSRDE